MGLIKAAVVGWHPGSQALLQRRVGGILKGIADVEACTFDDVKRGTKALLLVTYAFGQRLKDMVEQKGDVRVVGAELTLLPAGVKTLRMVDANVRLGVIAEHRRCANYFFSEIVRAGIMDNHVFIGTFDDMPYMPVDRFVVSEEMADRISKVAVDPKKVITVPRTISPSSAAEIIHVALEVATKTTLKTR